MKKGLEVVVPLDTLRGLLDLAEQAQEWHRDRGYSEGTYLEIEVARVIIEEAEGASRGNS